MAKTFPQVLEQLHKEINKAIEKSVSEGLELGQKEARSTKLFKHGNNFDDQIKIEHNNTSPYIGKVESLAEYSQYLEYGNNQGGDYIYPKVANVLHFFANGVEVFTKRVKAHGAYPFMENASKVVEEKLPEILEKNLNKIK